MCDQSSDAELILDQLIQGFPLLDSQGQLCEVMVWLTWVLKLFVFLLFFLPVLVLTQQHTLSDVVMSGPSTGVNWYYCIIHNPACRCSSLHNSSSALTPLVPVWVEEEEVLEEVKDERPVSVS